MGIQGKQHEKKQSNFDEKLNMNDYNFYMNIGLPITFTEHFSQRPAKRIADISSSPFHVLVRGKDHYL